MKLGSVVGAILTLAVASIAGAETLPYSRNLAAALVDTKAKLASGQTANIVVLGDSLSLREGTYLPYFRLWMQQEYGDAGFGYQGFSNWTGGVFEDQWTIGAVNGNTPPYNGLDGFWASTFARPYPPTHTSARFEGKNTMIRLHYAAKVGGGSFTVQTDPFSAPIATVDSESTTNQVRVFTHTFTNPLVKTLWFQPQGDGEVVILGQENVTTTPGVRIHRAANGGWGVNDFLIRNWTFDAQLKTLNPDLVIVAFGINDAVDYSRNLYYLTLLTFFDRLRGVLPNTEFVMVTPYDYGAGVVDGIVAAMSDVSTERGYGFINLFRAGGPRSFYDTNRYLDDGVHYSHPGGRYVGRLLYRAFVSDGATLSDPLTPYCAGDANLDNKVNGADLSMVLANFGYLMPNPYDGPDVSGDRRVDLFDLSVMFANWGCDGP